MDERQFIIDLWDVLSGNDIYCTAEQFREKYDKLRVDLADNVDGGDCIRFMDDHNEWHLTLKKVWCDETTK